MNETQLGKWKGADEICAKLMAGFGGWREGK
jgi:hypothetical protein